MRCLIEQTTNINVMDALSRYVAPTPRWPAETLAALVRLWDEGLTAAEVAARLGKTAGAVRAKLHKLCAASVPLAGGRRATRRGCVRRSCLYCGRRFPSEHVGNRLCPGCLEDGPFTSAIA